MITGELTFSERVYKRKVSRLARKMSNEELRSALWESRTDLEHASVENRGHLQSMIKEEVFSQELKNRELLEWALKTGSESS